MFVKGIGKHTEETVIREKRGEGRRGVLHTGMLLRNQQGKTAKTAKNYSLIV